MTAPEFSRLVRIDTLGEAPRALAIEADESERMALARRFGLIAIDRLAANLSLRRTGEEVVLSGSLQARVVQACVATHEPVPAEVEAPFEILFRSQPDAAAPDTEVELSESELDVVFYEGGSIDVGEAVAETLSLSLDPFPRAPGAEEALKAAGVIGEEEAGPFGALAALRDQMKKS
jgi:uncharacterized metal-binding protein YceD (DUF177 family)